jgi:carbon storage regulator
MRFAQPTPAVAEWFPPDHVLVPDPRKSRSKRLPPAERRDPAAGNEPAAPTADQPLDKEGPNMLVLTRRIGEQIVINGDIVVTVTAVQGDRVRIGVSAPPFVPVDREEVSARRQAGPASRLPLRSR